MMKITVFAVLVAIAILATNIDAQRDCPAFGCTDEYNLYYLVALYKCQDLIGRGVLYFDSAGNENVGSQAYMKNLYLLQGTIDPKKFQITIYNTDGSILINGNGPDGLADVVAFYAALDTWRFTPNVNPFYEIYGNPEEGFTVEAKYSYNSHAMRVNVTDLVDERQANAVTYCQVPRNGKAAVTAIEIHQLRQFSYLIA